MPIWWRRARFSSSRAARERKIENRVAKSIVRESCIGRENYETTIILISSDISRFSRGDTRNAPSRNTEAPPERVDLEHGPDSANAPVPTQRGRVRSNHGLQIGAHHSFNPADASVFEQFADRQPSDFFPIISERFNGNVNSDLIAVLETVCDRFFGRINSDRNPVDSDDVNSGIEGAVWKPENSNRYPLYLRHLGMTWECNVHVVRHLCGQFMMRKRRDQADHASWDPKTDRDPIWIYEGRSRRQPIEPPCNWEDLAGVAQGIQRARVNSQPQGIASPKHSTVLPEHLAGHGEICRILRHVCLDRMLGHYK